MDGAEEMECLAESCNQVFRTLDGFKEHITSPTQQCFSAEELSALLDALPGAEAAAQPPDDSPSSPSTAEGPPQSPRPDGQAEAEEGGDEEATEEGAAKELSFVVEEAEERVSEAQPRDGAATPDASATVELSEDEDFSTDSERHEPSDPIDLQLPHQGHKNAEDHEALQELQNEEGGEEKLGDEADKEGREEEKAEEDEELTEADEPTEEEVEELQMEEGEPPVDLEETGLQIVEEEEEDAESALDANVVDLGSPDVSRGDGAQAEAANEPMEAEAEEADEVEEAGESSAEEEDSEADESLVEASPADPSPQKDNRTNASLPPQGSVEEAPSADPSPIKGSSAPSSLLRAPEDGQASADPSPVKAAPSASAAPPRRSRASAGGRFSCPQCGGGYGIRSNMLRHLRDVHKTETKDMLRRVVGQPAVVKGPVEAVVKAEVKKEALAAANDSLLLFEQPTERLGQAKSEQQPADAIAKPEKPQHSAKEPSWQAAEPGSGQTSEEEQAGELMETAEETETSAAEAEQTWTEAGAEAPPPAPEPAQPMDQGKPSSPVAAVSAALSQVALRSPVSNPLQCSYCPFRGKRAHFVQSHQRLSLFCRLSHAADFLLAKGSAKCPQCGFGDGRQEALRRHFQATDCLLQRDRALLFCEQCATPFGNHYMMTIHAEKKCQGQALFDYARMMREGLARLEAQRAPKAVPVAKPVQATVKQEVFRATAADIPARLNNGQAECENCGVRLKAGFLQDHQRDNLRCRLGRRVDEWLEAGELRCLGGSCAFEAASDGELRAHLLDEPCLLSEEPGLRFCPTCRRPFTSEALLNGHVRARCREPTFTLASLFPDTKPQARPHVPAGGSSPMSRGSTELSNTLSCPTCKFTFKQKICLQRHVNQGRCRGPGSHPKGHRPAQRLSLPPTAVPAPQSVAVQPPSVLVPKHLEPKPLGRRSSSAIPPALPPQHLRAAAALGSPRPSSALRQGWGGARGGLTKACTKCSKTFAYRSDMLRHMRKACAAPAPHEMVSPAASFSVATPPETAGTPDFACEKCGRHFGRSQAHGRHLKACLGRSFEAEPVGSRKETVQAQLPPAVAPPTMTSLRPSDPLPPVQEEETEEVEPAMDQTTNGKPAIQAAPTKFTCESCGRIFGRPQAHGRHVVACRGRPKAKPLTSEPAPSLPQPAPASLSGPKQPPPLSPVHEEEAEEEAMEEAGPDETVPSVAVVKAEAGVAQPPSDATNCDDCGGDFGSAPQRRNHQEVVGCAGRSPLRVACPECARLYVRLDLFRRHQQQECGRL